MKKTTYLLALLVAGSAVAQEDCNLQYDGNGDGAVNVEDVLGVLSEFGEVCEPVIEYGPCGPDSTVAYNGYEYKTVEIDEQCWFAENLQTIAYRNGDVIPSPSDNDEWLFADYGCYATPDNSINGLCYGRLYNWYAVDDSRGLCPSGWHVPSDADWADLEQFLGMNPVQINNWDERGDEGILLKSTSNDYPSWDGDGPSGFNAVPAGFRDGGGWYFATGECDSFAGGTSTQMWSSSINSDPQLPTIYPIYRGLATGDDWIIRGIQEKMFGFSVRCIKD